MAAALLLCAGQPAAAAGEKTCSEKCAKSTQCAKTETAVKAGFDYEKARAMAASVKVVTSTTCPAIDEAPLTTSALKAYIDAKTGTLQPAPTDEELEGTDAPQQMRLQKADREPLSITENASGMLSALLGPEYMEFAVVHLGADGQLTYGCVTGPQNAARLVAADVPLSAPALETK
jgi:hypothetical protein